MSQKFENLKIKIFTRSMNRDLYKLSGSTINLPFERVRLTNTTADGYFYKILEQDIDYAINIDEDAFIVNNDALVALIKYFIENEYDNCGMPDGGVIPVRHHNPLVTNAFFNILNVKKIKKSFSYREINNYKKHKKSFEIKTPFHLMQSAYNYDNYEPYFPFFLWLSQSHNVLYLNANTHTDTISTILKNQNGTPFLLHSWFSRDYGTDIYHTKRINSLISECGIIPDEPTVSNFEKFINLKYFRIVYHLRRILRKLGALEYV